MHTCTIESEPLGSTSRERRERRGGGRAQGERHRDDDKRLAVFFFCVSLDVYASVPVEQRGAESDRRCGGRTEEGLRERERIKHGTYDVNVRAFCMYG